MTPPESTPRPDVRLHIDRLVLTGVDVRDRAAVGAAVQARLTELFGGSAPTDGLAARHGLERLDAGVVRVARGGRDGDLGRQIGDAVHGGLTR